MIEYHKTSSMQDDFEVGHSQLNELEKHPKLFVRAITTGSEDTVSMERGNLLHKWIENKESFIIAELDKPSEKLADVTEQLDRIYIKEGYKIDAEFSSYCGNSYNIGMQELQKYKDFFTEINQRVATDDEIKLFIYSTRFAREKAEYNANLKELTFLEKVGTSVLPYLKFLKEASGRIILTKQDKIDLTNAFHSIELNPLAYDLIFKQKGEHELELHWEEYSPTLIIKRKARLDKCIVDYDNKILTIPDLKSTNKPISDFKQDYGAYKKYNYGRQLWSYADGWFKTNKLSSTGWKVNLYNIVVQFGDDYPCAVYKTTQNYVLRIESVLERFAFHKKSNNWEITMEEQLNGYIEI